MSDSETHALDRRKALKLLGTGVAAQGLAGCSGSGDGSGSNQLGERVPTIVVSYFSDLGGNTTIQEAMLPGIKKNLENRLGVNVKVEPKTFSSVSKDVNTDQRTFHLGMWYHGLQKPRLDPKEFEERFKITWAGNNGKSNGSNYANCEYTYYANKSSNSPTTKKRHKFLNKSQSVISGDYATIPLLQNTSIGAGNTEKVEFNKLGKAGISTLNNPLYLVTSKPKTGNRITVKTSPDLVQTLNYPTVSGIQIYILNSLVNSQLITYNENYELEKVLAKDYTTENQAKQITFKIRDDAKFQNGDPVTAEDVQFTFKLLWDNTGSFPRASAPEYNSIKILDDKTVEFNFPNPSLYAVGKIIPSWGIFHKKSWVAGGAKENPGSWKPQNLIGSGPMKIKDFNQGQSLLLKGVDTHPQFKPTHEVLFRVVRSSQTARRKLINDELDAISQISTTSVDKIKSEMGEKAKITRAKGFTPHVIYPYTVYGPTKFPSFRHAVGAAIDRKKANALGFGGSTEPMLAATMFSKDHPWRPPDDMLTFFTHEATGSKKEARKALSDAGWGWDSNGKLHYPANTNLKPKWPKGKTPSPDKFQCINSENEFRSDYSPQKKDS